MAKRDEPLLIAFNRAERVAARRYAKRFGKTETEFIRSAALLLGGLLDDDDTAPLLHEAMRISASKASSATLARTLLA